MDDVRSRRRELRRWLWACVMAWAALAAIALMLYLNHGPAGLRELVKQTQAGVLLAGAYIVGRMDESKRC